MNTFAYALLNWYRRNQRQLPWRKNPDPYWIYVSEIMLQQTRMETALPYFLSFIRELPTLEDLADVDDDKLMKLWEGLGYYSRARNLKKGAQYIISEFGGILPDEVEKLKTIPGIGPYSAGAIASTLYQKPVCAIDGNVIRVFSRLYRLEEVHPSSALKIEVQEKVLSFLPASRPGDFNQALMELGALICKPASANCADCPLAAMCLSADKDDATSFPRRRAKKPKQEEKHTVLLLEAGEKIAIHKKKTGLLKGLYSFPMTKGHLSAEETEAFLKKKGLQAKEVTYFGESSHVFSHRIWHMIFYRIILDGETEQYEWMEINDLRDIAIASAFRKAKDIINI